MTLSVADSRACVREFYLAAISAVHGTPCIQRHLRERPVTGPVAVIAIGKAAAAMMAGARDVLGDRLRRGLQIAPGNGVQAQETDSRIRCIEGDHPVPGANSLVAGRELLEFIAQQPADMRLLFLVSGGTSSLVEVLQDGLGLDQLQRVNRWLLGSGLDIGTINRVRAGMSLIKGGRLAGQLDGRVARVLLISDVPGNHPGEIGSGLLHPALSAVPLPQALPGWILEYLDVRPQGPRDYPAVEHRVIADNAQAIAAAAAEAAARGFPTVTPAGPLYGDVAAAATRIVADLNGAPAGVYIWGGETTVCLPADCGEGGRNQQLALLVARSIAGDDSIVLLAAGTDGRDGNSRAAGAIIDGRTYARGLAAGLDCEDCLARADAGSFLSASGDALETGPTSTNVMDLVIALKH